MLEYDDIVGFAETLLVPDVNEKIRVAGVEVVDGNPLDTLDRRPQGRIDL